MKSDYFPIFINMNRVQAVVFGGGKIAARRAKVLLEFGTRVRIVAPEMSEDLQKLAAGEENLTLEYRRYRQGELRKTEGIDLVLAATDDKTVNDRIFQECRRKGILINTASDQEKCDFYFPGIARKREITVGVTANGQNHKEAAAVTAGVRKMLDQFFEENQKGNKS